MIVGTSIGALGGAAYAVKPDAVALEKWISEILGGKGKESKGLKLLERAAWNGDFKPDFLGRIVRIAQKEMFLSCAMFKNALLSENDIRKCAEAFVDDIEIKKTTIPFVASAVDILIEPAVGGISWIDFFKYRDLIRIGEQAALVKLEKIMNYPFELTASASLQPGT